MVGDAGLSNQKFNRSINKNHSDRWMNFSPVHHLIKKQKKKINSSTNGTRKQRRRKKKTKKFNIPSGDSLDHRPTP